MHHATRFQRRSRRRTAFPITWQLAGGGAQSSRLTSLFPLSIPADGKRRHHFIILSLCRVPSTGTRSRLTSILLPPSPVHTVIRSPQTRASRSAVIRRPRYRHPSIPTCDPRITPPLISAAGSMTSQPNDRSNKDKISTTSVIDKKNKHLIRKKKESKAERQRAAVRRFRSRERQRLDETLHQIRRMKQEVALINTAIDKVDEDIDLMKELIEIQKGHQLRRKLEARLASSQSSPSSQSSGHPSTVNTHPPERHDRPVDDEKYQVLDMSEMLSSPSDLMRMTKIIRYDAKTNLSRE